MSCKFVIGVEPSLAWTVAAWREAAPGLMLVPVALDPGTAEAAQDAALLVAIEGAAAGDGDSVFVALGPERMNLRRLELMALVKSRGLPMPPLLCRGAIVSASASVSENCYIGAGAIVEPACRIGYNSVIGAGALIGAGSQVGSAVFIDDGVQLGRATTIAAHATIGQGVTIGHGVKVGKFSIVDKPGCYRSDIGPKTFIHASHAQPLIVVGG